MLVCSVRSWKLLVSLYLGQIVLCRLLEIPHNFKPSTAKQSDNDMGEDEGQIILHKDLEKQILSAVNIDFLKQSEISLWRHGRFW